MFVKIVSVRRLYGEAFIFSPLLFFDTDESIHGFLNYFNFNTL